MNTILVMGLYFCAGPVPIPWLVPAKSRLTGDQEKGPFLGIIVGQFTLRALARGEGEGAMVARFRFRLTAQRAMQEFMYN